MNSILEGKKNFHISFTYNDEKIEFISDTFRKVYTDLINWLFINGYKFDESVKGRELLKKSDVPKNYIGHGVHYIPNSEYAILVNFGIDQSVRYSKVMLSRFGATDIKINVDDTKVVKFGEMENTPLDVEEEPTIDKVEKIKIYSKNPFRQSICVLGESGAGKSTTLEHILEFEGHEFEFIIPSASTTGLLSQFSPSRSGYIPSRLGKMIVEAFNNPTTLYTAVFDECHKSNVIEMINDELLQAISTKRNMGKRFISLDEDTSELYKGVDTFRGNILIPDNFGFIFISSKPRIIANNTDFFNRVELVLLTEADRDMSTSDELLSKVLPEEEKMKLSSTRND
jgi:hypothetical protein